MTSHYKITFYFLISSHISIKVAISSLHHHCCVKSKLTDSPHRRQKYFSAHCLLLLFSSHPSVCVCMRIWKYVQMAGKTLLISLSLLSRYCENLTQLSMKKRKRASMVVVASAVVAESMWAKKKLYKVSQWNHQSE